MSTPHYYIVTKNPKRSEIIQQILFSYDYSWEDYGQKFSFPTAEVLFPAFRDPNYIYQGELVWTQKQTDCIEIPTIDDLIIWCEKEKIRKEKEKEEAKNKIMIGDYAVKFNEGGSINVGCQQVDFNTIKKIYLIAKNYIPF